MRKILVCDHNFNIESISSCSQINTSIKFYSQNKNLSFNDNFDMINPDCIWINKAFKNINYNEIKYVATKVVEYDIPYIIPNVFVTNSTSSEDIISCILFHETPLLLDRVYRFHEMYVRFYTVGDHAISHIQYCGKLNSCKDLTNIIMNSNKILIDSDIAKNMCSFYNKEYALFKPKGTLSWSSNSINTISNMELFLSNENK